MMRGLVLVALFVSATAPVLAVPEAAHAQTDDAGAHFRRGVDLFKEADFRAALIEFRRAYDLSPNFRVLYNIGQCQLELQDYAGALRAYTKYLEGGGQEIAKDRRALVEASVKKLVTRVATVDIKSNVAGAEVRVDDEVVGTTPLAEPVLVSAGRRRFTVEKAGRPVATKTIDVAGGDKPIVSLPLAEPGASPAQPPPLANSAPESTPKPAPSEATTTPPASTPGRGPVWIGWVATGALAAGAVATGLFALDTRSQLDAKLGEFPGNRTAIEDMNRRLRAFTIATDVLAGTAAVALGLSLYFTLKSPSAKTGSAAPPRIGVGPSRVVFEGVF